MDVDRYLLQLENLSEAIRGQAKPLLGREDALGQARDDPPRSTVAAEPVSAVGHRSRAAGRGRGMSAAHGDRRRSSARSRRTTSDGAVAVLERRAVRGDVAVVGDRAEQVMDLVHERVAPAR